MTRKAETTTISVRRAKDGKFSKRAKRRTRLKVKRACSTGKFVKRSYKTKSCK